jgi:hypothetical protein
MQVHCILLIRLNNRLNNRLNFVLLKEITLILKHRFDVAITSEWKEPVL